MAYLVACYVGETEREKRPVGFTSRAKALRYLHEVAADARADGFTVMGEPVDGTISIHQGPWSETYVLSETSDESHLRKATYR